jgi:hypothetical protein
MLAWSSSGLRQINDADAFASRPLVGGNWPPQAIALGPVVCQESAAPDGNGTDGGLRRIRPLKIVHDSHSPFRVELVGKSAMTTD